VSNNAVPIILDGFHLAAAVAMSIFFQVMLYAWKKMRFPMAERVLHTAFHDPGPTSRK